MVVLLTLVACAFGHELHDKKGEQLNANANAQQSSIDNGGLAAGEPVPAPSGDPLVEQADSHINEFPTLHPLIVHFPIMLLMLAAVIQIIGLAVFKREFGWLVVGLALAGVVSAWLSSNIFHPHTIGLSPAAQQILIEHEQYADITFWLGFVGLVLKAASMLLLKMKWWVEAAATIVLVGAAVAVALAGHHGAELVHKFGIGPKGQYLDLHDH